MPTYSANCTQLWVAGNNYKNLTSKLGRNIHETFWQSNRNLAKVRVTLLTRPTWLFLWRSTIYNCAISGSIKSWRSTLSTSGLRFLPERWLRKSIASWRERAMSLTAMNLFILFVKWNNHPDSISAKFRAICWRISYSISRKTSTGGKEFTKAPQRALSRPTFRFVWSTHKPTQ